MFGSCRVTQIGDTPIILSFVCPILFPQDFTLHSPEGGLMPLTFCIQNLYLTSSNVDPFANLSCQTVSKTSTYLRTKIRWHIIVFFKLVVFDEGVRISFLALVFLHVLPSPGVQVPSAREYRVKSFVFSFIQCNQKVKSTKPKRCQPKPLPTSTKILLLHKGKFYLVFIV